MSPALDGSVSAGDGAPPPAGPIERFAFPTTLEAHVVQPGPAPRVHGYAVQDDLARHLGLAGLARLALVGELAEPGVERALEVALLFLAPVSVAEAPGHAAVLVRLCGGTPSALLGTAAIVLAERARSIVAAHAALFTWLHAGAIEPLPAALRTIDEPERDAVERLRAALEGTGVHAPDAAHDPSLTAACLAVLHACGLDTPARLECALTLAALPVVVAEGLAAEPGAFTRYPMDVPAFRYVAEAK